MRAPVMRNIVVTGSTRPSVTVLLRSGEILVSHWTWAGNLELEWAETPAASAPEGPWALLALPARNTALQRAGSAGSARARCLLLFRGGSEHLAFPSAGSCYMIHFLPRVSPLPDADSPERSPFIDGTVLTDVVRALIDGFASAVDVESPVPPLTVHTVRRMVLEGARTVLLEAYESQWSRSGASLYDRALFVLRIRAADPRYSVARLAQELVVPERRLQRAFAKRGTTARRALRQVRIELAMEVLTNPEDDFLGLEQVAGDVGFASHGAMRDAFVREGLPTPRRVRLRAEGRPAVV